MERTALAITTILNKLVFNLNSEIRYYASGMIRTLTLTRLTCPFFILEVLYMVTITLVPNLLYPIMNRLLLLYQIFKCTPFINEYTISWLPW